MPDRTELAARLQSSFDVARPFLRTPALRPHQERKPLIAGYAALYEVPSTELIDGCRQVIRRGAFDWILDQRPAVRALVSHHDDMQIASTADETLHLWADEFGLVAVVDPNGTPCGHCLPALIRRAWLNQLSFDYTAPWGSLAHVVRGGEVLEEFSTFNALREVSIGQQARWSQTVCVLEGETNPLTPSHRWPAAVDRFMAMESRGYLEVTQ